jgi:hypothetical protein
MISGLVRATDEVKRLPFALTVRRLIPSGVYCPFRTILRHSRIRRV